MKNKMKSTVFSVCYWLIVQIVLFVACPMMCLHEEANGLASGILVLATGASPILFWILRFGLKQKNEWHRIGTIVFHCLNIPFIIYCLLTNVFPIPFFAPYSFLNNDNVGWAFAVATVYGLCLFVSMLVIDLVLMGIRLAWNRSN